jgi:hypothetical protein
VQRRLNTALGLNGEFVVIPIRFCFGLGAVLATFSSQAHQPLRTAAPSDGSTSVERAVFASAALSGCRISQRASVLTQELHPGATLSREGFLTSGRATELWEVSSCGNVKRYLVSFEHAKGVGVRPLWLKPIPR